MILGVDVGGTSVKFGVVSSEGEISSFKSINTNQLTSERGFIHGLISQLSDYIEKGPEIEGIGIGFPGYLTKERTEILFLPNIPSVKNFPIADTLRNLFPDKKVKIENDAKCAALGEYFYGDNRGLENFLLITLGTGVGSGVIMNNKLFLGSRGNAPEIGHIIAGDRTLEKQIGISHIIEYTKQQISDNPRQMTMLKNKWIDPYTIFEAASKGDKLAISVFEFVGSQLGKALVSAIRFLDINHILLGGGIAGAFDFIAPAARKVIDKWMPPYYTDDLVIQRVSMTNYAGVLGAASLLMNEELIEF